MSKDKAETAPEKWWVLRGGFRWDKSVAFQNGSLYSGPYSTREDAFTARRAIERVLPSEFFIEQQPVTEGKSDHGE